MSRDYYLDFIERSAAYNFAECDTIIGNWKSHIQKSELFGYSPTSYPANFAELLGFMYQHSGDEKYAKKATEMLLTYEELKGLFPKEFYQDRIEYKKGLPPISDFISMYSYARAYLYIQKCQSLTDAERAVIERGVADCANFLMNFPEWGPMNRAAIRVESFYYAFMALPHHPDAMKWKKMASFMLRDSYHRWEEEDATGYHALWMHALVRLADTMQDDTFFRSSIPRYYLDYFTHLITPVGVIADFGDAVWSSDWYNRFIPIFEKGATVYREPLFKWAANKMLETYKKQDDTLSGYYGKTNFLNDYDWAGKPMVANPYFALAYVDAFRWADDSIQPEQPKAESTLVMDDIVGKKILFRDRVDSDATFMLLNYQDEGAGSYLGREYLRSTISVEEEKMHHGHSDENSIISLFYQGSMLLHDSGYRDHLPSSEYGGFRADYYHNRMVIRKNKRWIEVAGEGREQSLWEFIRNSGAYRPVQTQLIDFLNFERVDYARSRVTDTEMGYEWDRSIIFHKEEHFFVIVDAMKIVREDYYTASNLWHTQKIEAAGEQWFDTTIDSVLGYKNKPGNNLLVHFPLKEYSRSIGTFDLTRHSQDEICMYETIASHYHPGNVELFVTVLFPHDTGVNPAELVKRFEVIETDKYPAAVGLKYKNGETENYFCLKADLRMDALQANARPRYTYEKGKVTCGPFQTDAHFLHGEQKGEKLHWAAASMTKVKYEETTLMESLVTSSQLQPDRAPIRSGHTKWRCWEDEHVIED